MAFLDSDFRRNDDGNWIVQRHRMALSSLHRKNGERYGPESALGWRLKMADYDRCGPPSVTRVKVCLGLLWTLTAVARVGLP